MDQQLYNPDPVQKLDILNYKELVTFTLNEQFSKWSYDQTSAGQKCRDCCAMLQNKINSSNNTDIKLGHRYKLVFQCYVNQLAGQGMRLATRSMWNSDTDNLLSDVFKGKDFVATLFLWYVYQE
ncbi:Tctex-1 family protein [Spironucleus salmonicida]|uniref:Tctex-1 family protein n=1 Tax=Spironucleus salmonicida TaxID=348837 RepID=V6LLT4_9EUKA|nr:Tctex-1 family protein [Spironucleus salmonicida]|eukprot:EST41654.1 hypothetical protein SS50377_18740 [Spironucleus salmonicida]